MYKNRRAERTFNSELGESGILLEVQVLEGEMRFHDAGGLHSGPQHILLRGDVIRLGYPLQVIQVADGKVETSVTMLNRERRLVMSQTARRCCEEEPRVLVQQPRLQITGLQNSCQTAKCATRGLEPAQEC